MDTPAVSTRALVDDNPECPGPATLIRAARGEVGHTERAHLHEHLDRCVSCTASIAVYLGRHHATGRESARFVSGEVIGRGGMGIVVRAYDTQLRRDVALKLLGDGPTPPKTLRLLWEAAAMARVDHDNVVQVYDVGRNDAGPYIAMELVRGRDLAAWLEARERTPAEILDVFAQAARGMAAAHRMGLVHRDFKPSNVLVGDDGVARVTDFGLATANDEPDVPALVGSLRDRTPQRPRDPSRARLGTPRYMAPEQHLGHATDARGDQFSFAVALVEALTGMSPYPGTTAAEIRDRVLAGRIAPAAMKRLPRRLRQPLRKALASDPTQRYPSMEALLERLQRTPSRRGRAAVGSAVLGGLTVLGVAAALEHDSQAAPDTASVRDREVSVAPADARARLARARTLGEAHRYAQAVPLLEGVYFEARTAGDLGTAAQAAGALTMMHSGAMGEPDVGRRWARRALAAAEHDPDGAEPRARMWLWLAALDHAEGHLEAAQASIATALDELGAVERPRLELEALRQRASIMLDLGRSEDAWDAFAHALREHERLGGPEDSTTLGIRFGLFEAGIASGRLGALTARRDELVRWTSNPRYGWRFATLLAELELRLGRGEAAHAWATKALHDDGSPRPPAWRAITEWTLARALEVEGRVDEARERFEVELARDAARGVRDRNHACRLALGELELRAGNLDAAARHLAGLPATDPIAVRFVAGPAWAVLAGARLDVATGALEAAEDKLSIVGASMDAAGAQTTHRLTMHMVRAELAARRGRWDEAVAQLDAAVRWQRERGGAAASIAAFEDARALARRSSDRAAPPGELGLLERAAI